MPFVRLWRALIVSFLVVAAFPSGALAQGVGNTGNTLDRRAAWRSSTDTPGRPTSSKRRSPPAARRTPSSSRSGCSSKSLRASCSASAVAFRPRLSEINARLEQLGPAPPEGQAGTRHRLRRTAGADAEKAEINAVLGLAESLSIRVNGLIEKIGLMRSELFRNVLTKRYALYGCVRRRAARRRAPRIYELLPRRLVLAEIRRPVQVPVRPRRGLLRARRGGSAAFRRPAPVRQADRGRPDGRGAFLPQPLVRRFLVDASAYPGGRRVPCRDAVFLQLLQRIARRYRDISHVPVRRHRHRLLRQPAGQRRARAEAAELAADLDRFAAPRTASWCLRRRWRL